MSDAKPGPPTPQQLAGALAGMGEVVGPIYLDPAALFDLIGAAQATLTHPHFPPDQKRRLRENLVKLAAWFWTQDPSGVVKQLLQGGFDREYHTPSPPQPHGDQQHGKNN